jgi:hypothetical protein
MLVNPWGVPNSVKWISQNSSRSVFSSHAVLLSFGSIIESKRSNIRSV